MNSSHREDIPSLKEYSFNIENTSFELFAGIITLRDKYVKPYSHFFNVIIFVLSGNMKLQVENTEIEMLEGDVMILPPSVNHMPYIENSDTKAACISFQFSENDLEKSNDLYKKLCLLLDGKSSHIKNNPKFHELLKKCFDIIIKGNKYAIGAAFYEVLVSLILDDRLVSSIIENEPTPQDSDMNRVNKINTIANAYYDKDISVEDVAKMIYLSVRHTNRMIHTYYGCSWRELIVQKRMTVAADLLQTTEMSVDEISEYVGYSSTRGFYLAFKKYFDKPPGSFRRKK